MLKPIVLLTANTSWYLFNFRKNLIKALIENDYRPVILAPEDQYSKSFSVEYHSIKIKSQSKNPLTDLIILNRFQKIYKKIRPDIVLNFTLKPNIYSTIAASKLGIPIINNITGLGDVFTTKSLLNNIVGLLYKNSQLKADFIFFQNQEDKKVFSDWGLLRKGKWDILPGSGVNVEWFNFKKLARRKIFRFLFLGRFLIKKGIYEYANAAEIIKKDKPNIEFQILGFPDVDNPGAISKAEILNWEKDGVLTFLGHADDVRPFIEAADCIVLPSYYREGVPRSLLEALSMGRPIITTDNTGCRDVVEDGINGFMCQPERTRSLVESMKKMLDLSYKQRSDMGRNGRKKIIKDFDESTVIDKYISTIRRIL